MKPNRGVSRVLVVPVLLLLILLALAPLSRGAVAAAAIPAPPSPNRLVDDTQSGVPESLDPAWGFLTTDASVFNNVFQELVEYNGANDSQVVPVLASSYSVPASDLNYTFQMRSGVSFSNGDPVTAADAWFSLVRVIYMNAPTEIGLANYLNITIKPSEESSLGIAVPWGFRDAVASATGNPTVLIDEQTFITEANTLLSNFNTPSYSSEIQELISYPHQAYVVTGPTTLQVNLVQPYTYFAFDIAQWWGAVVDPAYVDSTGGVTEGQGDTTFNTNGGPGTGPYEIQSVKSGLVQVTLVANPSYWNSNNAVSTPNVRAAQIKTVVVNYALSATQVEQSFDNGTAQLAWVPVPDFGDMYNNYGWNSLYTFNEVLKDFGPEPGFFYFGFNTQTSPTNNNDYRLALVHAIDYSAILHDLYFSYQGVAYASEQFGPVPPSFPLYNSLNTTNYSYSIPNAAVYMRQAMNQLGYYVTMTNGTTLGTSSTQFPTQTFYYTGTLTPEMSTEFNIISTGLAQLGISTSYAPLSSSTYCDCSPEGTPPYPVSGWIADWTDPYYQLITTAFTTLNAPAISTYVDVSSVNATLARMIEDLPYYTSAATQVSYAKQVYKFMQEYAPSAWMPDPDYTFFVQPYVKGDFINPISYTFTYDSMSYVVVPPIHTGEDASLVIGQPDFTSALRGTSQNQLSWPRGVAFDSSGNMWVPDTSNNRVLEFVPPFYDGMPASLVLGQSSFTGNSAGTNEYSLRGPRAVAFDSNGNLWVADTANDRVLEFVPPFRTGMPATLVIGQTSFSSSNCFVMCGDVALAFDSSGDLWVAYSPTNRFSNNIMEFTAPVQNDSTEPSLEMGHHFASVNCISASDTCNEVYGPTGIAFASNGDMYVADFGNNRTLGFSPPFNSYTPPFLIIGQPSLAATACATSQYGLCGPTGIAFDGNGNLWIADSGNNRLLEFGGPTFTTGMSASEVIGQPDFTSAASETTQNGLYLTTPMLRCVTAPAFDPVDGTLWMGDCLNNRILQYGPAPTIVSCIPSSFSVGGSSDCTATVSGGLSPSGTVTFSQSSGTGIVTNPSSEWPLVCTLSSGSCSITVWGDSAGNATILATYSGDSNNLPSSGSYTIGVYTSTSTSMSGGSAVIDQTTDTGVSVVITGSSASDGTSVTFSSTNLGSSQPVNTGSTGLDAQFFDVLVTGISNGEATVFVTTSAVTSSSTMQYYFDGGWIAPSQVGVSGTTVCGVIPVSALGKTPIVIGHHSSPGGDPTTVTCESVSTPTMISDGNAVISQAATTGVSAVVTGSSSPDGTGIALVSQDLGANQPSGTGSVTAITPISYYDVQILGGSGTGTAQVYITNSEVPLTGGMQYWDGTEWANPSEVVVSSTTVCGVIPVSALGKTPIVIGHHSPGDGTTSDPPGATCESVSTPATISDGSAAINQQATTGVSVGMTGSTSPDGTGIALVSQDLGANQPSGTGSVTAITPISYYDVQILGGSNTGTALVYITNSGVASDSAMQYWDGTEWVMPAYGVGGTTVCGVIPVSALGKTPIVIGHHSSSGGDPTTVICLSVWASPVTIDSGQAATLTATAIGGSGTESYQWYSNSECTATISGAISSTYTTSALTATTTYCVTVTDSTDGTASTTVTVTVEADPTVSVAPVGPLTYDVGQSSAQGLTATVTYSGWNTASVEWYSSATSSCGTLSSDTGISGATFTPSTSAAGTAYYCAVVSDSGLSGYSYASNAVEVTVYADPTVAVTPAGPFTFDLAQTATGLTATVTYPGPNAASVEWYSSASSSCSFSSSDTSISGGSFTPGTASAGVTYYCAVVSDSGVSGYHPASNPVEVTVNPVLSAGAISPSAPSIDLSQSITLTSAASGGTPTLTVTWYESATCSSATSVGTGTALTVTPVGTGSFCYYYVVTDQSQGTPTGGATSSDDTVTVNSALTAPAAPTVSATLLDVDQTLTVAGTIPSTGTPTYSWQWLVSVNGGGYTATTQCAVNGGTGASAGATATCTIAGGGLTAGSTYNFELEITDSASTPESQTSSASSTVTVNSALTAPAAPSVSATALDLDQALTVTGVIPSTGTSTYSWRWMISMNGGAYGDATQCVTNSGTGAASGATETCSVSGGILSGGDTYNFELQVKDSATSPETQTSAASSAVTIKSALTAPGAPTVSATALDVDQALTVTGTIPSTGTSTYSWQWLVSVGGGAYSGASQCGTSSGTGASGGGMETCSIPGGKLSAGSHYNFELEVTDSATLHESATSSASSTVTVSAALTAPAAPSVSATVLDVDQTLTVTATIPSTGTSTYGWTWLVSINGAGYGATTQCATNSGTGAASGATETCSIAGGVLSAGDTYNFELKVSDSASSPEAATSSASSTVTVNSALTAPAAPSVSAAALYTSQTLKVTDTIPTTGTPTYSWQWLVSVNGGTYAATTQCATNSGTGASRSATVTCTVSGSTLTVGNTYNFELKVSDSASSPEAKTSVPSPTVTVQTPTTIVFACLPLTGTVGVPEVCAVVVANNNILYDTRPSGTVTFSGTLPPGMPTSCTLTKGTGIVNACSFSWTPAKGTEGSYSITATYGGDSTHGPSSTHGSLTIGKRSVSVTVSCTSPYTHSVATTCTVTVTDNSPGTPLTPTGTVTFTSSGPGGFSSASCTLSGGGATASCHVKFTPSSKGSYTVTANYAGDKDHASGAGSITFKVS